MQKSAMIANDPRCHVLTARAHLREHSASQHLELTSLETAANLIATAQGCDGGVTDRAEILAARRGILLAHVGCADRVGLWRLQKALTEWKAARQGGGLEQEAFKDAALSMRILQTISNVVRPVADDARAPVMLSEPRTGDDADPVPAKSPLEIRRQFTVRFQLPPGNQ